MAVDTFGMPPGVTSHGIEVFEKSGQFNPRPGVSEYYITACAGGGAGGIGAGTTGGSGGNSGEGVVKAKTYIPAPLTITIGAAGQANNGGGGDTLIGDGTLRSIATTRWPNGILVGTLTGGFGGVNSGSATDQSYLNGKMGAMGGTCGTVASFAPHGGGGGNSIFGCGCPAGPRSTTGRPTTSTDGPWGTGGSGSATSTTGYGGQGVVIFEW